jgi:uncharacterized membrane protein
MTNTLRLVDDDSSVLWLRTATPQAGDPFIANAHTLPSAPARVSQQPRAGRSGVTDGTQFHDGAVFQVALKVFDAGGFTRHQHVDHLRQTLRPDRRPYLYIQRDGWLEERRAAVRGSLASPIDQASHARLEVSLQLELADGVLEAVTESSDSMYPASGTGGRTYPKGYPWAYVPGNTGATKIINLGGGEYGVTATPLLMRLYGACTEPVISLQTTGEVFELDGVTLAVGQYLEIDMDAKTVYLNGDPALSYYNKVNFLTSTWWQLQPGDNDLAIGAATLDTSCRLDLFWTPRYAI